MGYLLLFLSKFAAVIKCIAVVKCGKIATGIQNNVIINLIRTLGCSVVSVIVCLIVGFSNIDRVGLLLAIASGVATGLMMIVWLISTGFASVCLVEVFSMVGGLILPLFLSPFLISGDNVTYLQWIGAFLLLVAVFMFSKGGTNNKITLKGLVFLLLCLLTTAVTMITQTCYSHYSKGSSEDFQLYTFLFASATLLITFFIIKITNKNSPEKESEKPKFNKRVVFYVFIAIVFLYACNLLSKMSATYLPQTLFYPLSYIISMPLIFLMDVIVFKEKVTVLNVIGLVLVVTAGVLVNI